MTNALKYNDLHRVGIFLMLFEFVRSGSHLISEGIEGAGLMN